MAYADFEFYRTEYYGNLISEEDFDRLSAKASDKLDYISNYRVPRYLDSIIEEDTRDIVLKKLIGKATCWLAEQIKDIEDVQNMQRQASNMVDASMGIHTNVISSISSGGESISFATNAKSSAVSEYISNPKRLNRYLFDGVREYLGGSGLLSQAL